MTSPLGVEEISSTERELLPYLMRHTVEQLQLPEPVAGLLKRGADEIDRLREHIQKVRDWRDSR